MNALTRVGVGCWVALTIAACSPAAVETTPAASESAAASISADLPGCAPACLPVGSKQGSVGPGAFQTQWFAGGRLSITLGQRWKVEDSQNELVFQDVGPPEWLVFAWLDPYAVEDLQPAAGIGRTPSELAAWLLQNPKLVATAGPAAVVAGGLPAMTIDLRVSDAATLEDPQCPDICINYFGFDNGPPAHGLARPGVTRLYLASVQYGGQRHVLALSFEALDEEGFADLLDDAEAMLRTIQLPVTAAPN